MTEIERTPDEWRQMLASVRVAGAPDPYPERPAAVRRTIVTLWEAVETRMPTTMLDMPSILRVMRANPTERPYLTALIERANAPWRRT